MWKEFAIASCENRNVGQESLNRLFVQEVFGIQSLGTVQGSHSV